jgi:hypothetical protein
MQAITKQYTPDLAGALAISSNHVHKVDGVYLKAKSPQVTREAAFSLALERLYRFCVRRVNLRVSSFLCGMKKHIECIDEQASIPRNSASSDGLDDDLELYFEKPALPQPRKPRQSFGDSISEELWFQDDDDDEQRWWSDTLWACPTSQPTAVTDDEDFAAATPCPSSKDLEVTNSGAPDTDTFHTRNYSTLLGGISELDRFPGSYGLTHATALPLPLSPDVHLEGVGCHYLAEPSPPKVSLSPASVWLLETDSDASSDSPTDSSMDLTDPNPAVDAIWESKATLPHCQRQHPAAGEECRLKGPLAPPYGPVDGPTVTMGDRVWRGESAWEFSQI